MLSLEKILKYSVKNTGYIPYIVQYRLIKQKSYNILGTSTAANKLT